MEPCLTFTEVGIKIGLRDLFQNVTFSVMRSDRVIIIGPSGEGKSVLLKVAAGLMPCTTGSVTRSGQISMAFQRNGLFDSMSAIENVEFALRETKKTITEAPSLLKSVGLEEHAAKRVTQLSGGQQKRLSIARALAVAPNLMIYDDPTAGLDPVTSFEISELIREKQSEMNHGILMVTSDLRVAFQLGTKVGFLCQGRVMEWGGVAAIRASENPYVHQFVEGLETGPLSAL